MSEGSGGNGTMGRDLIVGYDGSAGSEAALVAAIDLAQCLGDRIVVAFGYQPPGGVGEEYKAMRQAVKDLGTRITAHARSRAESADVPVEVVLVDASAAEALLQLADERDARMIVVGSYGEHPMKGAILGSTPNKLLHLADRPVLAVPAP